MKQYFKMTFMLQCLAFCKAITMMIVLISVQRLLGGMVFESL